MIDFLRSPKLKSHHLDRIAIVYVRQSTPQQVADHQESTARQYALVDRAVLFGWSRDRVVTIDDDLGKSGQSIEGRPGFQRLLAEVALDRVGIIFGLEMSRWARSCKDWHQLLELCARFRVLLADADGVFDPTEHSDRLLLGLHGMMNEAELHVLKQRMYQGKLNKAKRGELFSHPPIGDVRDATAGYAIDPNEQVQAVVRLIFDQFDRESTLHGLLRYLVHHQIRIPVRLRCGPTRGQLEWHRPNRATLSNRLRHPVYAGAYAYGRRPTDGRKKLPGRPGTGRLVHRPEECLVFIRSRIPAYITWERFEANRTRLEANRNLPSTPGAPRNGPAILGGLVKCGRCGRKMVVKYTGAHRVISYSCTRGSADYGIPMCQALSNATRLEQLVSEQILAAVEPAALEASLAAVASVEAERAALTKQWQLKRERAAFEVDRASRQFQACEPENRMVARELERRWEETLKLQRQMEDEFERWQRCAPKPLTRDELKAIEALASDLPTLWQCATTTPADRQRIAKIVLERVVVTVDRESEQVKASLHWAGGCVQEFAITRPVSGYQQQSEYPRLVERLRELSQAGESARAMAKVLNSEGFRPPKRATRFSGAMVQRQRSRLGMSREVHGSRQGLGENEYRPSGLAKRLEVSRDTIRRWMKVGWVEVRRDECGHGVIWADEEELERLRELQALPRRWENRSRLAELTQPKRTRRSAR